MTSPQLVVAAVPRQQAVRVTVIWLASRIAVFVVAAVGSWQQLSAGSRIADYLTLWFRWDTQWFDSIARLGYVAPYSAELHKDFQYNVAFFPGFPLAERAVAWLGTSTTAAGLLVSLVAGLAAAIALGRLTSAVGGVGEYGVLAWVAAPTAVFLAAAYTEALFCAFAFWAWALGRDRRWVWAGVVASAAALVRVNGVFLAAGLIVMFLVSRSRDWWRGAALLLPFVATAGYFAYLKAITGSWTAWSHAQLVYWKRDLVSPVTALTNTYHRIFMATADSRAAATPQRFTIEIVAMAILVAACVALVCLRWWAELAYMAVTVLSLGTSSVYLSVPRSAVVLFPLWMLLGLLMSRHLWFRIGYLVVTIPLLCFWVVRFTEGYWVS